MGGLWGPRRADASARPQALAIRAGKNVEPLGFWMCGF